MANLKGFSEGKREFRPVPFWSWNDKLDPEELLSQMRKMQEAGYGGFFMHSRVGLITPYLSEEWMERIRMCAERSEEYGLDAGLYDEDMWPSGYASGVVPAMSDDFKEKALVLVKKEELRPGDEIFKSVLRDNEVLYIARRTCAAGMVRFNNQCYIDTLNPHAVEAFLMSTHEKYKACAGDLFGTRIKAMFTDEPCYGIHWFYSVPHVTYSEYLRERILREKGYDISERCEQLFFDTGDYKKTRFDYYSCAGDQFCESFTKQYSRWCEENGLSFTGHLMAEETMYEQAQWTGGVMQNYAYMQIPGVDKLMRENTQLVTIKQLTSVAEQLEKDRALSECFAGLGHESGFYRRKEIMDWQAVNGINYVNMHLSHYSLRGERKRDYPPDIFYQQPYFKEEKLFSDYAARISQLAAYGKRAVRILVIQPLYSVFASYNPADPENSLKLRVYEDMFGGLSEALQNAAIDFHYGDENILKSFGKTENGKLTVGTYSYDTVILCHCESLLRSTLDLLKNFGGKIICLGQAPSLCEYADKAHVRIDEKFDTVDTLVEALSSYKIIRSEKGVIGCRRIGKEGDVYLFANTTGKFTALRDLIFQGAFALDITRGVAYPLCRREVTLYPSGSFAVFVGSGEALKNWGIELSSLPPVGNDGWIAAPLKEREIAVPAAHVLNENALVLDRADFESGETKLSDVPLESLWHYHFYRLADGTPYTMRYYFFVKDLPKAPVQLILENAENAESLTLNGIPLKPMRRRGEPQRCDGKAYIDLSFTRCEVNSLKEGLNVVELRAKKVNNITGVCSHRSVHEEEFYPTEAEAAYIIGDFSVEKGENGYMIAAARQLPVQDVASNGYPFYSGALEYNMVCSFSGNEQILLDCDCVYASVETDEGKLVAGAAPYVFDTRCLAGEKKLKIKLYNSLYALLGPHHIEGYDELPWVDAGVFNDLSRYKREALIKPFGLKQIKIIQGVENNESKI